MSLKKIYKSAKHTVFQTPEIERKVLEATSHEDKWGPTGTQMRDIAQATFNTYHDLPVIMGTIWRRINDDGKYWRHVYKCLLLLEYILKNGSEEAIRDARDHIVEIQTLSEFQHIDPETNKDVGINVRERSKIIVDLIHDEDRLRGEREKARQNAKKFIQGIGSDTPGYGGYTGGNYGYDREERSSRSESSSNQRRQEQEDEEDERPPSKPAPSSSSSGSGRPRAASGDNTSAPQPQKTQAVPKPNQPSLLDLDTPAPAPAQNNLASLEKDFFSSGFGGSQQPSSGFGGQPSGNNNFFGGAPASGNQGGFGAKPTDDWNDFTGSSLANQQQQEEKKEDKNDPWAQTHLFGTLKKDTPPSSNNSSNLTPLPMGQMAVPMGQLGSTPVAPQKPVQPVQPVQPKPTPNYDALSGPRPAFGGPQPGFGGPGFGGPQPGFGGPQPGFGGPQPGFGGPQPGFGGPGFGGPQPGFGGYGRGGPQPGFGGPQPGFGGPQPGFGGPQPGFGGPQPGFGGPQPGFGGGFGAQQPQGRGQTNQNLGGFF